MDKQVRYGVLAPHQRQKVTIDDVKSNRFQINRHQKDTNNLYSDTEYLIDPKPLHDINISIFKIGLSEITPTSPSPPKKSPKVYKTSKLDLKIISARHRLLAD